MKKLDSKKSAATADPKGPGQFKDLIPPGQGAAAESQGDEPRKKKKRKVFDLTPFVDEKTLGFVWRNIFLTISRLSKNATWELNEDEESQLAEGTNKVLSKHLPAWLENYLEEFSLAITLGFVVISRMQIPKPESSEAAKLKMPSEPKDE